MGNKSSRKKEGGGLKWKKEMKIVVLVCKRILRLTNLQGTAASGKSTFTRQMRLLNHTPWTQQELDSFYAIICSNIYDGMKEVCEMMKAQGMEVSSF